MLFLHALNNTVHQSRRRNTGPDLGAVMCAKLPATVREERNIINRIDSLPFHLSKAQRKWLEGLKRDPRDTVRREAECLWEMRFNPEYDWLADEGVIGPSEDYPEDDLDLPF